MSPYSQGDRDYSEFDFETDLAPPWEDSYWAWDPKLLRGDHSIAVGGEPGDLEVGHYILVFVSRRRDLLYFPRGFLQCVERSLASEVGHAVELLVAVQLGLVEDRLEVARQRDSMRSLYPCGAGLGVSLVDALTAQVRFGHSFQLG